MEKILIGKIVNAVGLKGEVKVYNYSDSVEIYENTGSIYVEDDIMGIEGVRTQKNLVILRLSEIKDRDAAERAKGKELFVTEDDLPELPEGEYYLRDLIGTDVILAEGIADLPAGSHLGTMKNVIQNTAQDIFEIETDDGKQLLIPRVPDFVREIDIESRTVKVRLIEGMIDLQEKK